MKEEPKIRLLIADDHYVVRMGLIALVNTEADMQVVGEAGAPRTGEDDDLHEDRRYAATTYPERPRSARVQRTITSFLTLMWRTGALMGVSPEQAAPLLDDRRQQRGNVERLCRFGEADDVVDDCLGVVAAQASELKRLVIDQNERAVIRRQQGAKPGFRIALACH